MRRRRLLRYPTWLGLALLAVAVASGAPDARGASEQGPGQLDWVEGLARTFPAPAGPPGPAFPWNNQYGRIRSTFAQGGITVAEGQAWDDQLRAIADVLKATPVISTSAGFFPRLTGFVDVLNAGPFVRSAEAGASGRRCDPGGVAARERPAGSAGPAEAPAGGGGTHWMRA